MDQKPKYFSYLRFSTPDQATGDSIRRQTALAEKWAKENGVTLDDSLRMEDHGLSGYHRRNVADDASLGKFLKAIETGKVPRGSVLLVESMDRLSRASVKDAQVQLMNILQGGVDVVTLADQKRYNWETLDELQLILSIFLQSRAHEESRMKGQRLASVWEAKRLAARESKRPATGRIPAWLRLNKDTNQFEVIPERAALIRRIFNEALAGDGVDSISRRLNKEGAPPWGTPQKRNRDKAEPVWNKSYVTKILTEGQVTGRYIPTKLEGGKRVVQPPIEGYYPVVIPKKLFDQVRAAMKSRTLGAGRAGRISNLVTHLVRCGYCGGTMVHINKGNGPKAGHGEYLACAKARVGKGCEYHSIPYLLLESALLQYCREIDLGALLEQDSRAEAIKQAQADLDTVAGALLAVKEKVEGIVATIPAVKNESMRAMLVEQLDKAGEEQDSLQRQRDRAASNLEALKRSGQTVANHVQIIRELDSKMKDVGEGERIAIRRSLKHAIARAVEKIVIYPEGLQRRIPSIESDGSIDLSEKNPDGWPEDMQSLFHGLVAMETGRENAAFLVKFRNGHHRLFKWNNAAKEFRQVIQTALVAGRAEVSPLDGVATTFDKDGNEILLCPDGINENESGQLGE